MHGKTVCYHHGGRTPRGLALPQTTHGRYSKNMPTRLLAEFEQAKRDPELLSLRENIALIDARPTAARADTGETFTCKGCKATKPLVEFHMDKSIARGHKSRCMECCNESARVRDRKKAKSPQLARMSTEDVRVYERLNWSR